MNKNIRSNAFDEFITKRCEEIQLNDESYQELNNSILEMETEFKKTLTPDQIKAYNEIEELTMKSIAQLTITIYENCLSDIENIRKIG